MLENGLLRATVTGGGLVKSLFHKETQKYVVHKDACEASLPNCMHIVFAAHCFCCTC